MRYIELNVDAEQFALRPLDAQRIVDAYIENCKRRMKPISAEKYQQKIVHFLRWSKQYEVITEADCADFPAYLESVGLKFSTRADVLMRVKQAMKWAHRRGLLDIDLSLWITPVRGDRDIKRKPATIDDVAAILRIAEIDARDAAIIATLARTGMRRAELSGLDLSDVSFDDAGGGEFKIRRAKGGRSRIAVFDSVCRRYLVRWIRERNSEPGPLFIGQKPGPAGDYRLYPNTIFHMVVKYAQLAGVRDRIRGCHDMRRVFITEWLKAHRGDSDTLLLMKQVGHSSLAMTSVYDMRGPSDIAHVMNGGAA
jgi:integrase